MVSCTRCGRANPDDARFCNACGTDLVAIPASREERKVVTVLFADVTGSTALGERLDAESLKELLDTFFAAMRAEIEAEGGTVEKFVGDAVMAAFGVPRVHEDDPARALRAALRMRARLGDVNAELEARYGVSLELRIGINTGEVMAAVEPSPGEALATGDAVNAAARLEQAARPGQVLVAERTARAARAFRFAEPQALDLRGKALPFPALELVAEQPVAEGALSGARVPLVGRRRELELLSMTYRRVVEEGRPHLATLYGDAGVGKSRLVSELFAALEEADPGPLIVRGRCLAYGDGITYWPLAELLRTYAGVLDTDPAEVARVRVVEAAASALAGAGVPGSEEMASWLASSIGLGEDGWRHGNLLERRAEIQIAWRSFLSALAAGAPTVVLVEDVHWADPALLELLEDVADRAVGPAFLLCTARPELTARRPTWGGGRRSFTGLVVEPLSAQESRELVDLLLDGEVSEDERAAIVERAEGNPFFLEELVRSRGGNGSAGRIPDTVQSALAARIDLLPADEKHVLQAAAVVGRVFWPGAVAQVTGQDLATLDELFDRLQDRDLVLGRLTSSMEGQRELIFRHALIRDVAYEGLPRRDRVRIHGELADWIERTFADRRREVVELVAHHRSAAYALGASSELRAPAYLAVADAAESALARSGFERAVSLARQALDLAGTPLERARALEVLGYAAFVSFDGSTAWESLREAADIILRETPEDRGRLARVCGFAVMIPTRASGLMHVQPPPDEVRRYLRLGLQCAGEEDSEALALLLASQGFWDFGFGIDPQDASGERARAAARRAREMARRMGRPDLELVALDALSSSLNVRGRYGLAGPIDSERLELARRIHDPFEVVDSFYTAAWAALEVGRYETVLELGREVEARDLPVRPLGSIALSAIACVPLGRWDEALAEQQRLRRLVPDRTAIPPSFASGGYGVEAFIHEARGDRAAADTVLAEIEGWEQIERTRPWPYPLAAVAYARRGEFEAARRLLDRLVGRGVFRPRELEARCILVAEEGAWDEAPAVLAAARGHGEEAGLLTLPLHADRLEGRALLAAGHPERAVVALERSAKGFAELGARWDAALSELALAEALVALGRRAEAGELLARAEREFERLRVPRELERARALLA